MTNPTDLCTKCGGWANQKPCEACARFILAGPVLLEAVELFLNNPGADLAQHQQAVAHMRAGVALWKGEPLPA